MRIFQPSRLRRLAHLLPELVQSLLGERETVEYPFGPAELPPNHRGEVQVDAELCRGCGACARDCPASALTLERDGRNAYRLIHYRDRCAYCGQCTDSCRFGAIRLADTFVPATTRRDVLTVILAEKRPEEESETQGCSDKPGAESD
ncbi:MAG: 4Fe-4S binding protein [Chloroflexi bacterium]|nr:4Fe-4S binding protein [Chloroflexota bacterium]